MFPETNGTPRGIDSTAMLKPEPCFLVGFSCRLQTPFRYGPAHRIAHPWRPYDDGSFTNPTSAIQRRRARGGAPHPAAGVMAQAHRRVGPRRGRHHQGHWRPPLIRAPLSSCRRTPTPIRVLGRFVAGRLNQRQPGATCPPRQSPSGWRSAAFWRWRGFRRVQVRTCSTDTDL